MTWTDPNTRNTGDLVTAQIYNDEIVTNLEHLHDRTCTLLLTPLYTATQGGGHPTLITTYSGVTFYYYRNTLPDTLNFAAVIPDDFDSLTRLTAILVPSGTLQIEYDCYVIYGAIGEHPDNHNASRLNQTIAAGTADHMITEDISSLVPDLAAGDYLQINIRGSTNANNHNIAVPGILLEYARV